MKKVLHTSKKISFIVCFSLLGLITKAQDCEWRLTNPSYNSSDPDGAGPATGSVTFTLQVHTVSGSLPDITGIGTGWCWQTANAMLPTGVVCGLSIPQPANVTMSPLFAGLGFSYNYVDECSGTVNFTVGGQTFNRRSSGTIDGGTIILTPTWVDVYTVTLWTLNSTAPQGGYTVINSGEGATNTPAGITFNTYTISDVLANGHIVTSLTYTTPLPLGASVTPVTFSSFNVKCNDKGAAVVWATETEANSSYFDIQKSINGTDWTSIGNMNSTGNSSAHKDYQYQDIQAGTGFYRIRQVDLNGNSSYTAVIPSACSSRSLTATVYPIPARDKVTVTINSDHNVRTDIELVDATGRIVLKQNAIINKGLNNIVLDIHSLPSGNYILVSSDASIYLNKKVIVSR
ncbi:MAG: T9SS type A sorting domain-containing protein [Ferruginibacter sp.]